MILLCNTLITETPPSIGKGFVFRENLRSYSNFDIFKYSLASLAVAYPWKRVILYISLDEMYKHRQAELEGFIRHIFEGHSVLLRWNRNEYQQDWKDTWKWVQDDELIWFYCNHDHIFIDSSQDYLKTLVEEMRKEKMCSLAYSHWPECIRSAKQGGPSRPFDPNTYKLHDNYLSYENESFDSIQIITKDLYYNWWMEGDLKGHKLPRPDYFGIGLAEIKPVPVHKVIVPYKELCRHFDGYQHCNPPITNDQCPAIEIPDGFFENNIKIHYSDEDKFEELGFTNFNPTMKYYKAYDSRGVDYKWTIEDTPLFWKGRISSTYIEDYMNEESMIQHKLQAILNMFNGHPSFQIDLELEEKIIKFSLINHPNYTI